MLKTAKRFKTVEELKQLATKEIVLLEGGGPRLSLPIPVRRLNQPLIAFMVYRSGFRPGLVRISPPHEVIWLDPASGKLIAKTSVSPADFAQTLSAGEGSMELKRNLPPNMAIESFRELRVRLPALYDALFELWATNPSIRSSTLLQDAAREFLKSFDLVSEPPLLPYYNALGCEYFEWVRELAK